MDQLRILQMKLFTVKKQIIINPSAHLKNIELTFRLELIQ